MNLPLFPLSSHILPAGRLSLRIFEPRYVRMIKQACANDSGFVVCMLKYDGSKVNNTHIFSIGTICKVVDFDVLEDGLLGVTVEGVQCVNVTQIETEHDGLRNGDCVACPSWTSDASIEEFHPIDTRLKEIFERYPEVSSLYQVTAFNDPIWVINRWIELLPIGAQQKQDFLVQPSYKNVFNYLSELID